MGGFGGLGGGGGAAGLGSLASLASLGSLAGLFTGTDNLQSPSSILKLTENLIPLLGLLPLVELFPNSNSKDNYVVISSLPLILNLVNSISNFNFQV